MFQAAPSTGEGSPQTEDPSPALRSPADAEEEARVTGPPEASRTADPLLPMVAAGAEVAVEEDAVVVVVTFNFLVFITS